MRNEHTTWRSMFRKNPDFNVLSLARVFAFSSRDLWSDVPFPSYFDSTLVGSGSGRSPRRVNHLLWEPRTNAPKFVRRTYATLQREALSFVNPPCGLFSAVNPIFRKSSERKLSLSGWSSSIFTAINPSLRSCPVVNDGEGDKVAMNASMTDLVDRLIKASPGRALYSLVGTNSSESLAAWFWLSCGLPFRRYDFPQNVDSVCVFFRVLFKGKFQLCSKTRRREAPGP